MQEEAGGFTELKPHLPNRKETVCVCTRACVCVRVCVCMRKNPTEQAHYLQMWGQVPQELNTEATTVSMAFPDASVVKNPTNTGFNVWSGKIPQAAGVTSPLCHNYGSLCLESVLLNKRSHHDEKPARHN